LGQWHQAGRRIALPEHLQHPAAAVLHVALNPVDLVTVIAPGIVVLDMAEEVNGGVKASIMIS
jgi:hypothetical protein